MDEAASRDPADGRIVTRELGPLLLIGLDRVPKRNAFSAVMVDELAKAYTTMESNDGIRCGVLYAEGGHFTAGLQLDRLSHIFKDGRPLFRPGDVDPTNLRPPLRTKPLVAAVQGICYTLGIELMLAADVVIAAEDCRFAQLEVKRGIFANQGGAIRMVERAGLGNALRYLLTGDEFDAQTAYRLGFVQEVVPVGQQLARALEVANTIAVQAPHAVRATLNSARKSVFEGPAAAINDLIRIQSELMHTEDAAEGVQSFIERRKAVFKGR